MSLSTQEQWPSRKGAHRECLVGVVTFFFSLIGTLRRGLGGVTILSCLLHLGKSQDSVTARKSEEDAEGGIWGDPVPGGCVNTDVYQLTTKPACGGTFRGGLRAVALPAECLELCPQLLCLTEGASAPAKHIRTFLPSICPVFIL